MKRIVHIKLSTILGIVCLVICILPATQNIGKAEAAAADGISAAVPFTSDWTSQPLAEAALVNTYLSHIQEASQAYYARNGEDIPVISWYYVTLKEMTADFQAANPDITLTFTLMPYVGTHNPVGVDEVTFEASHTGQITLLEYKRTESSLSQEGEK